ncbi:hypothetical protein PsYK624_135770 [Phanerochaete sordida]|uniref:Protein kinase domain-containing protein n=1 Tax=Phanerochaete sordida TaxID=48140 RepID=A0A9P3LJB1_9APHY|nr:hypothetical protein PsYK624_135770 [Phanerochaete sordida]
MTRSSSARDALRPRVDLPCPSDCTSSVLSKASATASTGISDQQVEVKPVYLVYGEKKHHRILFKEVGTTIVDVQSLSKAFGYLAQVSLALYALHTVGWVHRDVSSGNIIIYDDRAILGDVEYAKQEEDTTRHDVRTGTAFFMAAEVDSCKYLLLGLDFARLGPGSTVPQPRDGSNKGHKFLTFEREKPSKDESTSVQASMDQKLKTVFRHNPLHDLESVFWLALYLLLCTLLDLEKPLQTSDAEWAQYATAKDVLAADLFHNAKKRIECITADTAFATMLSGLHPRVRKICESLEGIRAALNTVYKLAESDPGRLKFDMLLDIRVPLPSKPKSKPMPLHHVFANAFFDLSDTLSGDRDITFGKIPSVSEQRQMMHDLLLQQQNETGAKAPNAARTTGDIEPARKTRARNARQPRTEDLGVVAMTGQLKSKLRPRD